MFEQLDTILPGIFAGASVAYLWLSVRVSRASAEASVNSVSHFLLLVGTMTAGSAFAYNATDPNIYGIGRTLTFFSAGFLPVVLYNIYREYTVGKAPRLLVGRKPQQLKIANARKLPRERCRGEQRNKYESPYHCMVHPRRNHSSESSAAGKRNHQPWSRHRASGSSACRRFD